MWNFFENGVIYKEFECSCRNDRNSKYFGVIDDDGAYSYRFNISIWDHALT